MLTLKEECMNYYSVKEGLKKWLDKDKGKFIFSLVLAIMNILFKILPYFMIGKLIKNIISENKDIDVYLINVVVIIASFVISEIFHHFSTTLSHKATFAILGNIRKQVLDKLSRVPLGCIKDTGTGTFKNIIVERIDSMEVTMAHIIPEFTSGLLAPIIMLVYFFFIDWRIALLSLVPVALGVIAMGGMMRGYQESFHNTIVKTKALNDAAVEYINGIEVIKAFGKTKTSYEKFVVSAKEGANCFIEWMRRCNVWQGISLTLTPYTLLTVLPFGALFVKNQSLLLADFVMCIIISLGIVTPVIGLMSYMDDIRKMETIFGDVIGILELEELKRPINSQVVPVDHSLELDDVCFGYHDTEVLHHINMRIASGTVNAIVGPSGSGKSTIAKLIASMWDVQKGVISLGGVDIREMSFTDYSKKVAYVAQDNYLFNDTIMENIRMGNLQATNEEVIDAAKKSGCYEFIMSLEQGFDTIVGGSIGHLSGGQRQRISIIRAMLKDAPIIILDEATAYTDPENEALMQNAIAKLVKGKTLIVIAHRLFTIVNVDNIFVVNDGEIVERGNHRKLLEKNGLYAKMWSDHISVKDDLGGEEND